MNLDEEKFKINGKCKFLKDNISIKTLIETKYNVKIFTFNNEAEIIGFRK